MTIETMKEKIEALNKDEVFTSKLSVCETAHEICDLYATEGIVIDADELDAAVETFYASDEMSEDILDKVAGGVFISGAAFLTYSIVYSCVTITAAYKLGKMSGKK